MWGRWMGAVAVDMTSAVDTQGADARKEPKKQRRSTLCRVRGLSACGVRAQVEAEGRSWLGHEQSWESRLRWYYAWISCRQSRRRGTAARKEGSSRASHVDCANARCRRQRAQYRSETEVRCRQSNTTGSENEDKTRTAQLNRQPGRELGPGLGLRLRLLPGLTRLNASLTAKEPVSTATKSKTGKHAPRALTREGLAGAAPGAGDGRGGMLVSGPNAKEELVEAA